MKIDRQGRIYLGQIGASSCIHVRETDGSWHSISTTDLLPAHAVWFSLSPEDVLYVTGIDPDGRWYVSVVEDQDVTTFWLRDLGYPTAFVLCIDFDLAGRAWIMTRALDDSAKIIIYDPADESFDEIPWSSGMVPSSETYNAAVSFHDADQSFRDMGVLWWLGASCPTRINLAPRTELLLDKAAYSFGEAMQVDAYFANQAGSIPIDWYAAVEDEAGNLFYWPSFTQAKTPAFAGLLVPTDTALILPLDTITIPDDVPPGHYKWKTGFTRAGQDTWLGLGFTASGAFDIVAD